MTITETLFAHLQSQRGERVRHSLLPDDNAHANASQALSCDRQIGFKAARVPESEPFTVDSLVNFQLGDNVHDLIQAAMLANPANYPEVEAERSWALDWISGRLDVTFLARDGERVITEIKSVSEFAFEAATRGALDYVEGKSRRERQDAGGPKIEHVLQACLTAWAMAQPHLEFDEAGLPHEVGPVSFKYGHIIYVRKTAVKDQAVVAEWKFPLTACAEALDAEVKRLMYVINFVRNGSLPGRRYLGIDIADPLDKKAGWQCRYCSFQGLCSRLAAGIVDIPVFSPEAAFTAAASA